MFLLLALVASASTNRTCFTTHKWGTMLVQSLIHDQVLPCEQHRRTAGVAEGDETEAGSGYFLSTLPVAPPPPPLHPPVEPIAFVHYHKTGHDLSQVLASTASRVLGAPVANNAKQTNRKRECLCETLKCTAGIVRWTAPELVLPHPETPACYRVVHMVRDPMRWAVSFYDYHRQEPTPEKWVLRLKPVCSSRRLELYIDVLEPLGARRELFDAAAASCNGTVRPGWTIMDHLRGLPEEQGLRFMAYAGLVHGNGGPVGDLPRSMANAAKLRQLRVHNLFMDDVIADLRGSMAHLAHFIAGDDAPATRRRLAAVLTERLLADGFVEAENRSLAKKIGGKHITTTVVSRPSGERKTRLIAGLERDPVLFELAALWWRIVGSRAGWQPTGTTGTARLVSASAAPLSEYSKLMTRWRRPGSRFAECLQKEAAGSSGSYVLRRGQFLTAGVEGAGHHMFEAMPPSLCPANSSIPLQRRCGLQQSLPYGVTWRRSRTAVPKLAVCSQFLPPKTEKSLLLVRDPVDAFTSALSRFWRAKKVRATGSPVNDTLRGELAAEYEGWLRLEACASQMPCESAVLVSYELLLLFPSSIVPRLADFLGVDADDADLARWVAGLRSPGSDASRAVRASWAGELSGVDDGAALRALRRPLPYSCNSTAATNIATKLRDEIGRWDAKRPETWALIEPWMTALPSMHSDRAPGRHPAETFPWPHLKPGAQDELEWPAWAKTCMASGETHQCYDAFRAEVRRWFYEDHPLSVFPLVPMSAEPCA